MESEHEKAQPGGKGEERLRRGGFKSRGNHMCEGPEKMDYYPKDIFLDRTFALYKIGTLITLLSTITLCFSLCSPEAT